MNANEVGEKTRTAEAAAAVDAPAGAPAAEAKDASKDSPGETPKDLEASDPPAPTPPQPADASSAGAPSPSPGPSTAAAASAPFVPEPRAAAEPEAESDRAKSKKPRRAVRAKSGGGTKTLVVWRDGRLHYADENVLVVDLDEAASPEMDVHDVVDRLAELRDAVESAGRAEAVAALGEIIQEKALS